MVDLRIGYPIEAHLQRGHRTGIVVMEHAIGISISRPPQFSKPSLHQPTAGRNGRGSKGILCVRPLG